MQRSHWSASSFAVVILLTAFGCARQPVEVMAVANCGFLVRSSHEAVLIDALFRATAPFPKFLQQGPSDGLLGTMRRSEGAFAAIDLVLVTHAHPDHHHAPTAVEFLENHPETTLVGTAEVAAGMAEVAGFDQVSDRVVVPDLAIGECTILQPNGIELTVCRGSHSGDSPTDNHVYLVDFDGFRLLHEGDAERRAETFAGLAGIQADVALLHDWFVFSADGRTILKDTIAPSAVLLMHHRWDQGKQTRKRIDELDPDVAANLPPITVLAAETARATF